MATGPQRTPTFVGVVHLPALPGGPHPSQGLDHVLARAEQDAATLREGGADAIIVENFGDAPFHRGTVDPHTVACMTRAVLAVRQAAPELQLGVNVLRNDAAAAIGIAAATKAHFVRINVHVGAMVTDQGVIEGDARNTLLLRRQLEAQAQIVADVLVKHAVPLGSWSLSSAARDTVHRGRADIVVVTGDGTSRPTHPDDVATVRQAVPGTQVWVGSGLTPDNASTYGSLDGAIVGTWLHQDGDTNQPLDLQRVRAMKAALDSN
ncbi:MAG: BtpA/SgcQ family protein [Myxococcales bacterium]|nr:BtpA/SgcQ family protein [Myxococcales bacterium]